jgi:putative transposase
VLELSVQPSHIHLACSIPPKIAVSTFVGFLKGKLAIKLFRSYPGLKKKPYWGNHFWARGYFVTTFAIDAEIVRRYVRHQEKREKEDEEYQKGFDLFPDR